ncbi:MAG: AraC family transcriptional regulator [Acidobacteriota bacterium]
MSLIGTLLLVFALHGLFLVTVLLTRGTANGRSGHRVLALLLLVTSTVTLLHVLAIEGFEARWPHLKGLLFPLWFLLGPLTLSYVRRLAGKPWSRIECALLASTVVWLLPGIPFFLLPAAEKARYYDLVHWFGTPINFLIVLYYSLVAATSLTLAHRTVKEMRLPLGDSTEPPEVAHWKLYWLPRLLFAILLTAIFDVIAGLTMMLTRAWFDWLVTGIILVLCSLIYGVGYLMLVHPRRLLDSLPAREIRYLKSTLQSDGSDRILERLERLMREEQPFLDEGLSLGALADRLDVSRHHLSQAINQGLETSFYDYINRLRIDEARRLLETQNEGSITMLDLAYQVGFGSSASFYRAFKRHVGVTPKAFVSATTRDRSPTAHHTTSPVTSSP